jgi:hypothetical protein
MVILRMNLQQVGIVFVGHGVENGRYNAQDR